MRFRRTPEPRPEQQRHLALLEDHVHLVRAVRLMSFDGEQFDYEAYLAIYPYYIKAWKRIKEELSGEDA